MSTKNQSSQTRKFVISVLLLVGLLLPPSSVFAQTPTPPPGSFAKQRPSNIIRSQNPATAENTTLLAAPNLLLDPSFEASAGSNLYWEQSSTNFGPFIVCPSTAPGPAGCGNGGGTAGPRTGSAWAWFGGVDFTDPSSVSPEAAIMSQNVTFPSCGATLQFYLWIGDAQPGSDVNDFFLAGIDGNIVFLTNATQIGSYPTYTLVSVDVSSFANGAVHQLDFYSNISGQNVNFNLDDVSLVSGNCAISGTTGVEEWLA
jgi:hypothetical protein